MASLSLPSIHRIIPKHAAPICRHAFSCCQQTKSYHHYQIARVWFAGCEDRQSRIGLGVARYQRRTMWQIRNWFRAAGSSARNVTGGRKLARHDSWDRLTLAHFVGDMPPMSTLVGRLKFTIAWGHCDPAGIVFNPRFFEYFDLGSWSLFETALGIKPHELYGTYGIVGIPLVDSGARFIAPARFGDEVELISQIGAFRRSSFDVDHRILVRGEVAVEGRETRVWAGRDPDNPDKLKGKPIPPEVTAKFQVG
jgi:4-hydroxybenzoyl-CoA thioesterase